MNTKGATNPLKFCANVYSYDWSFWTKRSFIYPLTQQISVECLLCSGCSYSGQQNQCGWGKALGELTVWLWKHVVGRASLSDSQKEKQGFSCWETQ